MWKSWSTSTTELTTRELALKKGVLTSGCGYPKEIAIVLQLQELFGKDTMRKIAFARDHMQISEILISSHGLEAEQLYFNVDKAMWAPFKKYINKLYDGENAPLEKAKSYDI